MTNPKLDIDAIETSWLYFELDKDESFLFNDSLALTEVVWNTLDENGYSLHQIHYPANVIDNKIVYAQSKNFNEIDEIMQFIPKDEKIYFLECHMDHNVNKIRYGIAQDA